MMDDRNAFERQLASEVTRMAGPEPRVDALAIARSAMTTPSTARRRVVFTRLGWFRDPLDGGIAAPRDGGSTMFSALKFIAASVIVALFGGFLIAGILTTPSDDQTAPAAVTESASPTTTDELLSGMVTEEVEPGVIRVVNDGYRDLSYPNVGYPGYTVDVTPDGSVWLSDDEGRQGLFRLGEEAVFEFFKYTASWPPYLEAAPDGSLWALGKDPDWSDRIFSFDGEGWTERATTTDDTLLFRALTIGPDGTAWVAASDRDQYCPISADCLGTVLIRLEDDGSLTAIEDWADVYDRDVSPDEVAVSPDGDVWLIGQGRSYPHGGEVLLRFDGEGWEAIPGPEGWKPGMLGRSLDFDPEGALWVKANETGGLARFDDPGWTVFTEADGVEPWGGLGWFYMDLLTVAADGSLWLNGLPTIDLRRPGPLGRHDLDLVPGRLLHPRPRHRPRWQRLAASRCR